MTNFAGFYILGDSHDDEEEILGEAQKFRSGSRDFNYWVVPIDFIENLVWVDRLKVWALYLKTDKVPAPYVGIDVQHLPDELLGKLPPHTRS